MQHGHAKHQKWISRKISKLVGEGYAQEQAVAIAHSMASKKFGMMMKKKRKDR